MVDEKAAADKAEAEAIAKAQVERARIADANAAVAKAAALKEPLQFSGSVGLPFAIYGGALGTEGTLTIGGVDVVPKVWREHVIKGVVPLECKPGKATVTVNGRSVDAVI